MKIKYLILFLDVRILNNELFLRENINSGFFQGIQEYVDFYFKINFFCMIFEGSRYII